MLDIKFVVTEYPKSAITSSAHHTTCTTKSMEVVKDSFNVYMLILVLNPASLDNIG